MIQTISLATLFIGTTAAAIWDLKTTEVPDQLSYAMIGIAILLFSYQSFSIGSYEPILNSLMVGLPFLGFGFLMYYLGQWGGADALILGSVGFFLPALNLQTVFPFPLTFLFNLFLIGAAYMLIYGMVFALMNKRVVLQLRKDFKANSRLIFFGSIGLFVVFFFANYYIGKNFLYTTDLSFLVLNSVIPLVLAIGLFLIWKFAKVVEDYGFKRKILVSKLKVGDMLMKQRKLTGITEKQLRNIRKSGTRYVWIKEGVRFAPAFVLALLFTVFYGDVILLLLNFI